MSWLSVLYVTIEALSLTVAGIYFAAWLMQRQHWSYLLFSILALSIGLAGIIEHWMLLAETPEEYATALRWFHVPIWSGFVASVALVHLRLRPRLAWVGGLAVGLRTLALVANFLSGPNLNFTEISGIEHFTLLGETVATPIGTANPWMLVGQAALLLSILFIVDGGISSWRRRDGLRPLLLAISLLTAIVAGALQAILGFWGVLQLPLLFMPVFLLVAIVLGTELSLGLLRAARAEHAVELKDAALDISEQRLNLAADAADTGFWSLDGHTGEIWATAKTRQLFGLAPDANAHLADFLSGVHPRDRAPLENLIIDALRSGGRYRCEFRVNGPGQQLRWLAGFGRVIGADKNGPKTLMGVTVDITARKAMQDQIRLQRTELERMSRKATLAELSTALAHELNQPLSMILTNAEAAQTLLAEPAPNLAEVREILSDIVSADRRAANVIRHLRALADRGEPERERVLLDDLIHRVLGLLASEIDERGMRVELDLAPGLPAAHADPVLIEQVLLNLLDNACTAVAFQPTEERRLSIVTRAEGDEVSLEITDNGPGLSDPQRAFDPFYSTKPGGLGMGLAIVRSIVSSHRGRVWAESVPGHGTTVHVRLPLHPEAS
jgi:two-component system, LuxR family, sensor kinase FixL